MAIPKTLKKIDEAKALAIINKHLKAGTGYYEYSNNQGDFIYNQNGKEYLIRELFGTYETGRVAG